MRVDPRDGSVAAASLGHLVVRAALYGLIVLALAGCGSSGPRVRAVTFGGIAGYLVEPTGRGSHPGVVLVHGSGGDRRELLPQAKRLAQHGVLALTITMPRVAARPTSLRALLASARAEQLADDAAVRAAARELRRRGATRLGYLGWSAGAKTGAFVTDSFAALALLSAGAATVDQFAAAAPPAARPEVRRVLSTIDPIRAIARGRPGTILLEDGRRDEIVPRAALENVIRAAPPRTTVRWYDAGHALNDRAWADARDWLYARLQ